MYSVNDSATDCTGFPHSDIVGCNGSYHLTDAFRRLARPSSPLTARASTVYAWSLNLTTRSSFALCCKCLRDSDMASSFPVSEKCDGMPFQFSACSGLLKSK